MSNAQRKPKAQSQREVLLDYVAAVRYPNGQRDIFHVRQAYSLADAREMVELEVGADCSILLAVRR